MPSIFYDKIEKEFSSFTLSPAWE